jgi:signal transduction histidine kinase
VRPYDDSVTDTEPLQRLIDSLPDATILADADGVIVLVNARVESQFGHSRAELLGTPWTTLVTRAGRGVRKDGTTFPAEVHVGQSSFDGRLTIHTVRDLTQAREAERALERAEESAAAARAELDAFSHSVAHDLRSPLRSIDGFSLALLEDAGDTLDPAARGHLDIVRRSARRMAELMEDLLTLTRVSRSELHPEVVDLTWLFRSTAASLQRDAPDRAVELVVHEGLNVTADRVLITTAIEHLLGNAWKFSAGVAKARIELGFLPGPPATYFVRDNGAGFDMAFADKLFGAFQRMHSEKEFEGSGIGLAIVQRIVRRHGGRVWAEAQVGEGATLYFSLAEGTR